MYAPPAFRVDDPEVLRQFVAENSFATVVTADLTASHLPLRMRGEPDGSGRLLGHMARANDQWKQFDAGAEVLTIFNGPHAYVSPSWYESTLAVPTWNYATVHVYGIARLIEAHADVVTLLDETVEFYERRFQKPWRPDYSAEFRDELIAAIVAFEVRITRIEAKFKLGQNRPAADQAGVLNALVSSSGLQEQQFAEFMRSVMLL